MAHETCHLKELGGYSLLQCKPCLVKDLLCVAVGETIRVYSGICQNKHINTNVFEILDLILIVSKSYPVTWYSFWMAIQGSSRPLVSILINHTNLFLRPWMEPSKYGLLTTVFWWKISAWVVSIFMVSKVRTLLAFEITEKTARKKLFRAIFSGHENSKWI